MQKVLLDGNIELTSLAPCAIGDLDTVEPICSEVTPLQETEHFMDAALAGGTQVPINPPLVCLQNWQERQAKLEEFQFATDCPQLMTTPFMNILGPLYFENKLDMLQAVLLRMLATGMLPKMGRGIARAKKTFPPQHYDLERCKLLAPF